MADATADNKSRINRQSRAVGIWVAGIASATIATLIAGVATNWLGAFNSDGPPLTAAAEVYDDHCMSEWFVPRAPDQLDFSKEWKKPLDPNNPNVGWNNMYVADGGHPASPAKVYLTIQGRTNAEVVLTGISVVVQQRRPAPAGTVLDDPCGDPGAWRWLSVDLDQDPPMAVPTIEPGGIPDDAHAEEREAIRFPYKVSVDRAESFLITANAVECDCDWVINVKWQSQGRSGTLAINDAGKPFRTIGTGRALARCWSSGRDRCHPYEPR